jgi:hypothetical protein
VFGQHLVDQRLVAQGAGAARPDTAAGRAHDRRKALKLPAR